LVHIIFEKIREVKVKNLKNVKKLVEESDEDLYGQYDSMLTNSEDPGLTARLFQIIMAAKYPLSVDEINIATNIEPGCRRFNDIDLFRGDIEEAVKDIGGFMVRISNNRVYLVHETARAYLLQSPQWWQEQLVTRRFSRN
jgi:hypothetical protein